MGTGSFSGVKRPGRGVDHPPPSKCRGQERVGLYLYSPSGPSWPVMGAPLPLPLCLMVLLFQLTVCKGRIKKKIQRSSVSWNCYTFKTSLFLIICRSFHLLQPFSELLHFAHSVFAVFTWFPTLNRFIFCRTPLNIRNGYTVCFMKGARWIFKYYVCADV